MHEITVSVYDDEFERIWKIIIEDAVYQLYHITPFKSGDLYAEIVSTVRKHVNPRVVREVLVSFWLSMLEEEAWESGNHIDIYHYFPELVQKLTDYKREMMEKDISEASLDSTIFLGIPKNKVSKVMEFLGKENIQPVPYKD